MVVLNGTTLQFSLPRGATGEAGIDGNTPIFDFSIDGSGNLIYRVTGYENIPSAEIITTEEWQ